jgi:membrane-associated phospholipid phosphatase
MWAIPFLGLAAFALLAWQVRIDDSAVWHFDKKVAEAAKEHAENHPAVLGFARIATDVGGVPAMVALAIVCPLLLCICGQPRLAAIWFLAAAMGGAIDSATKDYVRRPRPNEMLRDEVVTERNFSFPSGHSMGSIVGYGLLAYTGLVLLRRRVAKFGLVLLVVTLVLTVGFTRIYLRAHWCSDVAGGWLIGWCWLALCIKVGGAVGC